MTYARLRQGGEVFFAALRNGVYYRLESDIFDRPAGNGEAVTGEFSLLAPIVPSKILALGVNYGAHASEVGLDVRSEPLLFMKPPSAVLDPGANIVIANPEHRTDYEAELAVVIGKQCRNVTAAQAEDYILGYTCANDVSDRVLQQRDGQWIRAKGFDTYCPLGPHIVTDISPRALRVRSVQNGQVRQDGNTEQMITDVFAAVAFISGIMTLLPGDVILTGTPDGIGPLASGDEIEIRIDGVGSLVNRVI